MPRIAQRLALIGAITASIFGYLLYTPNIGDMEQLNRVRALGATMKIAHLIGSVVETFGVGTRVGVIRGVGNVLKHLKDTKENAGVQIEDTTILDIPVRIARPLTQKKDEYLPAIVFFHGGAFYMGSVDTHNSITSAFARLANVVVISVDYRLAPEYPFPTGLEDCSNVAKYVLEHGDSRQLRIDRKRVAFAGDSAGGNFAAVLAMRFATQSVGDYKPRLQILIYPVTQLFDLMLPSYMQEHYQFFRYTVDNTLSLYLNTNIDGSIYANNHTSVQQKKLYRKYVDWSLIPAKYRTLYQKPITDNVEGDPGLIERAKLALTPEISPLLVDDNQLAKLPPTYVLSVGHDRLRDEAFIYAERVKRAGVPVVHNHYEKTFHGSIGFLYGPFGLDIAHTMIGDIVTYIKANL